LKKNIKISSNLPFGYGSFKDEKHPLDWKKILHDEYILSDALSFKKWDKNLDFPTSKFSK